MLLARTRFAFFAIACAFFGALFAVAHAPQSVFPSIALHRVEIFADAADRSAEDVRNDVALPLESATATLPYLRTTRTYADPGELELELDFDPASDANDDLRAVRAALETVRERLPAVTNVTTMLEGPEDEPVVTYALMSQSADQATLLRRTESALVPTFVGTPDLGRLTAFGGPRDAYEVHVDPQTLAARGTTLHDVVDAIASGSLPNVAGSIVRGEERLAVRAGERVDGAAALGRVAVPLAPSGRAIATVPLRSLARVRLGEMETGRQASFDATHAVLLNAYAAPNGDALELAHGIEARLPALRAALPPDVRVTVAWDQTRLIAASQRALRIDMLLGAAIAFATIAFFLRDRALTFTAAIVLPVALVFAAFAITRAGLRFDLMTLGGLAIAIGLIVDEIIVVVEAVAAALERGAFPTPRAAIASAVRRIAKPLVASTAANLVVFVPLALLGGVPGSFFRALSITLGSALVISIALSLFVAPSLAEALGVRSSGIAPPRRLERSYVALLRRAMRAPLATYAVAVASVAIALVLFIRTPTDFLPNVNEGQYEIKYSLPPGTSAAAADSLATQFERSLMLDPATAHVARLSGVDTNGYVATPPDAGTIRVTVKPDARDDFDTIADRARNEIRNYDPYAAVEVHQLLEDQIDDLSGAPEPIQVTVSGPSQAKLATIAGAIADSIADVRGVVDTFDGVTWEPRSIRALPTNAENVAPAAFADDVRARAGGIVAADLTVPGGSIPILVHEVAPLDAAHGVRLGPPVLSSTVREENGQRIVRVTAEIEGAPLSTTIAAIRKAIAYQVRSLPPGYAIEIGGAIVQQRAALREFATVFGIAVVLVYGVLVLAFDSFRLPLVVLAAVPLTPLGVEVALALTHTPLNVASFMGMLLLVGIVVRNGILLVESANRRTIDGATPVEAMERAAVERLRPIAMTTVATLGALAPLAFGLGAGSEMERPLAIAVIGGIVTSTALTIIVVPVLYAATARRR
jgi:multidrug efflux pump subunit AcrB